MKKSLKIFWVLGLILLNEPLVAQESSLKTISVYGFAEKSLVPDEIYFTLNLTEYTDENGRKASIEELESDLIRVAKGVGIPKNDIEIKNLTAYQYYVQTNDSGYGGQSLELAISKFYLIKGNDIETITLLVKGIDKKATTSITIDEYNHSLRDEISKELKQKALKNAWEEASNMLTIEDKKSLEIIKIEVLPDTNMYDIYLVDYSIPAKEKNDNDRLGLKRILFKYQVLATFSFE